MAAIVARRFLSSSRAAAAGVVGKVKPASFQQPATTTAEEFALQRQSAMASLRARGVNPYPHYEPTHSRWIQAAEFRRLHERDLKPDEKRPDLPLTLTGRIVKKRQSGSNLIFYELRDGTGEVQILVSARLVGDMAELSKLYARGDIVQIEGYPGKTTSNELSLFATKIQLLAPCMRLLPEANTLKHPETRARERHLDMIVNSGSRQGFLLRSQLIRELRRFLEDRGFIEVETPILSSAVGGAAAKPFETKGNAIGMELRMRISPELFLKRLVVGGIDRVFEIGKQFRNEGIDATHNPEFTTCEFYQAFATFDMLMRSTQELLSTLVIKCKGTTLVTVMNKKGQEVDVDFAGPYKVLDIIPELEKILNTKLPDVNDNASVPGLMAICDQHGVQVELPHTPTRILDSLVGRFLEPMCDQPTFLLHHPLAMSPLAKEHPTRPGVTQRFELIVAGRELVNAYSELNDPEEQRLRFKQQAKERASGDLEAHEPDAEFCEALEYGLPPTAGWGLGIDRLVMMLTKSSHLRDVLFFPIMKPK